MKIALVAQGRFHAFDLAKALLARGHAVTVFTNYPAWAAARFGVPAASVRSCWPHGVAARIAGRGRDLLGTPVPEAALHQWFGRWAASALIRHRWDMVHCWSGVSEELLRALAGTGTLRLLMRGSSHIRTQASILTEETRRTGVRLDHPSAWMIAREEREYALADRIVVLSRFAYDTFVQAGVAPAKLRCLPLGAELDAFRPTAAALEARCQRLLAGEPLRLLYIGALSLRKGLWDLAEAVEQLDPTRFHLRLVGPRLREADLVLARLKRRAEWIPPQPQAALPHHYAWGDLFLFPTLEDGYGLVLAQAIAAGLPVVTTPHCAGPEIVHEGENGWIVPIRSPDALAKRLNWCGVHRAEVAAMARAIPTSYRPRDWADVAADMERLC